MKRISAIISLVAAVALCAGATGQWTLQGVKYDADTLRHYQVGPGTTMTVVDLNGPVKLRLFFTTTDLTNPNVDVKTICGAENLTTNQTIPDMVAKHNDTENIYFAGVNSDLFSSLGPIGTTVVNGELYKNAKMTTGWYAVAIDKDKKLHYGSTNVTYRLYSESSGQMSVKGMNVARESNDFIIYTFRKGTSTATSGSGIEVPLVGLEGGIKAVGTTRMQVSGEPVSNVGNMTIPSGGFVLSANASWYIDPLKKLKVGDIVEITPTIQFDYKTVENITEMSGGCPMILTNGSILDTDGVLDHLKTRRPRTALGSDASGTKMTLMVVEGDAINASVSAGLGSKDLAAIMLAVGCTDAINFDGGGSSTMYTSMQGVINNPSDGHLRKVRNGWFLTTPNRGDNSVASIAFADYAVRLVAGDSYTPTIYGYNEQGLLVNLNVTDFTLACEGQGVNISGTNVTFGKQGVYTLKAVSEGKEATVTVTVDYPAGIGSVKTTKPFVVTSAGIPAGSDLSVSLASDATVTIWGIDGRLVGSTRCKAGDTTVPASALSRGVYVVNALGTSYKMTIN